MQQQLPHTDIEVLCQVTFRPGFANRASTLVGAATSSFHWPSSVSFAGSRAALTPLHEALQWWQQHHDDDADIHNFIDFSSPVISTGSVCNHSPLCV